MAMHYVYILESLTVPGHFYVGSTKDLRERIRKHHADVSAVVPSDHGTLTFDAASNVYAAFPAKLYSAAAACLAQVALSGSNCT